MPPAPAPTVYAFDGLVPVVDATSFVHPTASLIGDVIVGPQCYIGPGASLRADFGRIVIEAGSNLQDNCILHAFPNRDLVVGRDGHVGHGAVLHGCVLEENVMVGMLALVMDEVVIGRDSIVAAMSFLNLRLRVPPRSLVKGVPGRVERSLSDEEVAWKLRGTAAYQDLARRCLAPLQAVPALRSAEANRPPLASEPHEHFQDSARLRRRSR